MKVKVNAGKGPIAGNYGLKNDGDVFTLPAHQGKELETAGMVTVLDDTEGEDEKPTHTGKDMTKLRKGDSILRKEQKEAERRQTKEEKHSDKTKDTETEPTEPAPAA